MKSVKFILLFQLIAFAEYPNISQEHVLMRVTDQKGEIKRYEMWDIQSSSKKFIIEVVSLWNNYGDKYLTSVYTFEGTNVVPTGNNEYIISVKISPYHKSYVNIYLSVMDNSPYITKIHGEVIFKNKRVEFYKFTKECTITIRNQCITVSE